MNQIKQWINVATITVLMALALSQPVQAAQLVMFEEAGCMWCARFNREIGGIYDKTEEGRRAPLRRLDIHKPLPTELSFLVKGGYTPTFVLIHDGREIGRIRGYPGDEFFWGLLDELLKKLPKSAGSARNTN